LSVWREPFVSLRLPKLFNLRSDPFEAADRDASLYYDKWFADRGFVMIPAQAFVAEYLKTFEQFPPRQRPASFSINQALEKAQQRQEAMAKAVGGGVK
jgi:arylsulfatase